MPQILANSDEKVIEPFLMQGILFCNDESIRKEFYQTFGTLATHMPVIDASNSAGSKFLKIMSTYFAEISKYPCRQFFDLFNELIDMHFAREESANQLFNAELLLTSIIDKIRQDK